MHATLKAIWQETNDAQKLYNTTFESWHPTTAKLPALGRFDLKAAHWTMSVLLGRNIAYGGEFRRYIAFVPH